MTACIALDLDGTLLDCRMRQVALAAALVPGLDEASFWSFKREGATTRDALAEIGVQPAKAAELAAAWAAAVEEDRWLALDRPLPGALSTMRALRGEGHSLAIVTARRRTSAVYAQIERLGFGALVEAVDVVDPRDPMPAKTAALRALSARAFVGDTESDALAARSAHVPFVAVASGQRSANLLWTACGVVAWPDIVATRPVLLHI